MRLARTRGPDKTFYFYFIESSEMVGQFFRLTSGLEEMGYEDRPWRIDVKFALQRVFTGPAGDDR